MLRQILAGVALMVATFLVATGIANANAANSMQPAHVYFGDVISGQHPKRLVTLHNGTGADETITMVSVAGSGGGRFTLVGKSALLDASPYPRCKLGTTLAAGARCVFDVRVHTTLAGFWRSVLGVHFNTGNFGSAELRAHVLTGAVSGQKNTPCTSWSQRCG